VQKRLFLKLTHFLRTAGVKQHPRGLRESKEPIFVPVSAVPGHSTSNAITIYKECNRKLLLVFWVFFLIKCL